MSRSLRFLKRMPFTITLVTVLIVLASITGPIGGPSRAVRGAVGIALDTIGGNKWWSLFTSNFFVNNLAQLIIVVICAAVGVGLAERLMGTWRTIAMFAVTGVFGSALGLVAQTIGVAGGEYWSSSLRSVVTLDPLTPIFGTLAVASAYASVFWRRRIRILLLAGLAVFLLYSGQPTDLYRVLAVIIGWGIGAALTRQRIRLVRWRSSYHETRVLLASVAAIFALGPVITLVSHSRFGLLSPLGVLITHGLPRSRAAAGCSVSGAADLCSQQLGAQATQGFSEVVLALVPLLVLLVGVYGLLNGRRAAVYLVASVAALDGILAGYYFGLLPVIGQSSHLAEKAGHAPEFAVWMVANALLPIAFAGVLLSQRQSFPIATPWPAVRSFAITLGTASVASCAAYLGLGMLVRTQFKPPISFIDLVLNLPERFVPLSFLLAEQRAYVPATLLSGLIYNGVGPVLWIVVLVALVVLLGVQRRPTSSTEAGKRYRRLLQSRGDSMAFPGTWAGNTYWFDDDGTAAIAFRVVAGCAVTIGNPIGTPRDPSQSLLQFIRFCDLHAWIPVLYGLHEEWADQATAIGWSTTIIAEETIIDPETWTTTGKKWQDVRSSINRAAREGIQVTWSTWQQLPVRMTNEIAEISELWVVEKKLPELGFTLGGLDQLRDPEVLLGVATDRAGHVQAVTSWMPTWRDGQLIGLTLDFMRRRVDSMNGVMEFVIAEAASRAQRLDLEFLSLSGAPLAMASDDERDSPLDRVLGLLGRSLEPVYGFRSLLSFKKKFQPRLVPLYLAYPDALSLPAIAVAISRCYLPDLDLRESAALVRGLR